MSSILPSTVINDHLVEHSTVLAVKSEDLPSISISNVTNTQIENEQCFVVFTVSLDRGSERPITVNYTTVDDTAKADLDYQAESGLLTFAPYQTHQTISIAIKNFNNEAIDKTFWLYLSEAINGTISEAVAVGVL